MPLAEELSQVFARMSGLLLSEESVHTALGLVTSLARDTIPGAEGAGVTLIDAEGRLTTASATSELVAKADTLQYELGQGPCLTACAERVAVRIDDLEVDRRWPQWRAVALPLGLRSSLSVPMVSQDRVLGAVKVYGVGAEAFSATSETLLTRFAAQAAILLANVQTLERAEQLSESLQEALRARNVIAVASGILMERHQLTEGQAFLRLVDDARRAQRELVDEATHLTDTTQHGPE